PPEIEKNLLAAYHMDEPLWKQYARYVGGIVQGDFGPSFKVHDFSVAELLAAGLPASMQLGGYAMLLAVLIGLPLGCIAAMRQNSTIDYAVMGVAMTGIAVPNFVVAPLLTLVFGVYLKLLPAGGWGGGALRNMVLPIIALGLPQVAYIARLTRGSMVEVLRSNYIRTARAKGLTEGVVLMRHAIKAAILPVVSYLGPAAAGLMTGSVVIEIIFQIPGIGRYFIQSALNRDYTVVMGVVVAYGVAIILFNLLVDLVYGLLDPKVRYD
ncbi:MAG TPA: ABC transporter permease subunit, partial [Dongiaceae bacterium]|nr:ABC transporter permease subunit [Dongiaceae bacterium]